MLFIMNWLMDAGILAVTAHLYHKRPGVLRLAGSAALAAGLACVQTVITAGALAGTWVSGSGARLIFMGLTALLTTGAAFGIRNKEEWFLETLTFILTGMFVGGVLQAFFYQGVYEKSVSGILILAAGGAVFLFMIFGLARWERSRRQKAQLFRVILENNGLVREVTGLLDTGNRLYTPGGKRPVSIVEYKSVKELFPASLPALQVRLIPYSSLGNENGVIAGIIIERMTVLQQNDRVTVKHPVIGLYKGSLSENKKFQMILHPDYREGETEVHTENGEDENGRNENDYKGDGAQPVSAEDKTRPAQNDDVRKGGGPLYRRKRRAARPAFPGQRAGGD